MTKIFISYRRDDTRDESLRYYRHLRDHYPAVFLDTEDVPPATAFPDVLRDAIRDADLVLAVIGPRWAGGDRIGDPADFVRQEIEHALDHGKRVLPVLVRGAGLPDPDGLPASLRPLTERQAVPADGADLAWLVPTIERSLDPARWDGPATLFAGRVRALLAAVGVDVSGIERGPSGEPWFRATSAGDVVGWPAGTVRVGCTVAEPRTSAVTGLAGAARTTGADHAVLVVDDKVDAASLTPGTSHSPDTWGDGVEVTTFRGLAARLAPLGPYVEWLRAEHDRRIGRAGSTFVDLAAAKSDRLEDGSEVSRSPRSSLVGSVERWTADQSGTQLALLGDFGSGKSWFCLELARRLLPDTTGSDGGGDAAGRLPLLLELRHVRTPDDVDPAPVAGAGAPQAGVRQDAARAIFADFCRLHGLHDQVAAVLTELNRQGLLLLLCDGFDEMPRAAHETVTQAFERLRALAEPASKVVITSRTLYFRDVHEESEVFLGDRGRRFDILYLRDFSTDQIRGILKARFPADWGRRWSLITDTYGLLDLVRRPFVLDMVLEILPAMRGRTSATLAELYDVYTRRWIEAVGRDRPQAISPRERRPLMQRLAWTMFEQDTLEVRVEAIAEIVAGENYVRIPGLLEAIAADLTTQSYLQRDSHGRYQFAHKSFLEFFVADRLATELAAGRYDLLAIRRLSPEIVAFLTGRPLDAQRLYDHLATVRGRTDDACTAGNVLSLLRALRFRLSRRDFSGLVIEGADLSGAHLRGSSFAGSTVVSMNVTDAQLTSTDFTDVTFKDLNLGVRSSGKGVAVSRAGTRAVTLGDNSVSVQDTTGTGTELHRLRGPSDSLTSVQLTLDGRAVAAGSFDHTATVWRTDVPADHPSARRVLEGHTNTVYDVAFDPAGRYLFTAGSDSLVRAWSVDDGAELKSAREHRATVYSINAAPDGAWLATGSFDATVGLWRITTDPSDGLQLRCVERFEGHGSLVNGVAWSPDSRTVASASNDGTVRLWDVGSRRVRAVLTGHQTIVWSVAYSPDGRLLASGDSDGVVRIWDVSDDDAAAPALVRRLDAHEAAVWSLAFQWHDDVLVSGSLDGYVRSWSTVGWARLDELALQSDANQRISCRGMRISGATGLSPLQEQFLTKMGARR